MDRTSSSIRVLVTGAKGQLGSEIGKLAGRFPLLDIQFTDVGELDITHKDNVKTFFRNFSPQYVINCAAYTAVDKAESQEGLAYSLNAKAPEILAEAAKEANSLLIHVSTDYVFDGMAYMPYTEETPTSPSSVYGRSKLLGEEAVLKSGVGMVIRTSWLYSEFGKNFVKTIIEKSQCNSSLRVVFDQVGSPTWAHDLANSILHIVQKGRANFKPDVYHYSNEGVCSWYDFACEIVRTIEANCEIFPILTSQYPTPAHRPHFSVLSKEKIKKEFGVEVPYWRDSLKACLDIISRG